MITFVIPMAGAGRRFHDEGWKLPKPLIPTIPGVPMAAISIGSLRAPEGSRFVFLCQQDHIDDYDLGKYAMQWGGPSSTVIPVRGLTQGAACTAMLAADEIDSEGPLVIANCDQWVRIVDQRIYSTLAGCEVLAPEGHMGKADGAILTMRVRDASRKWSYVREDGPWVVEVAEKRPISDVATVGVYGFSRGGDFLRAASEMIRADDRTGGEFYVAPVYNRLIREGAKVLGCSAGEEGKEMMGLGTPEDLARFNAAMETEKAEEC